MPFVLYDAFIFNKVYITCVIDLQSIGRKFGSTAKIGSELDIILYRTIELIISKPENIGKKIKLIIFHALVCICICPFVVKLF